MPAKKPTSARLLTDYILENMSECSVPWRQPSNTSGRASIMSPIRHTGEWYRGINNILLMTASIHKGFSSPHWLTYNQAKDLEAQVRKGERGTKVSYYGQLEDKTKIVDGEPAKIPFINLYTAFNVEQVDNLPEQYEADRTVAEEPTHKIHNYLAALDIKIIHGNHRPEYVWSKSGLDNIRMPNQSEFIDDDSYMATLAHEVIHSTGNPKRLDRLKPNVEEGDDDYCKEEIVAELGSVLLCSRLGLSPDTDNRHIPYIKHWMQQMESDSSYILKAASQAEKAVNFVFDNAPALNDFEAA